MAKRKVLVFGGPVLEPEQNGTFVVARDANGEEKRDKVTGALMHELDTTGEPVRAESRRFCTVDFIKGPHAKKYARVYEGGRVFYDEIHDPNTYVQAGFAQMIEVDDDQTPTGEKVAGEQPTTKVARGVAGHAIVEGSQLPPDHPDVIAARDAEAKAKAVPGKT